MCVVVVVCHTHILTRFLVRGQDSEQRAEGERQININSQCAKVPGVSQKAFPTHRPKRHHRRRRLGRSLPSRPPKPTLTPRPRRRKTSMSAPVLAKSPSAHTRTLRGHSSSSDDVGRKLRCARYNTMDGSYRTLIIPRIETESPLRRRRPPTRPGYFIQDRS